MTNRLGIVFSSVMIYALVFMFVLATPLMLGGLVVQLGVVAVLCAAILAIFNNHVFVFFVQNAREFIVFSLIVLFFGVYSVLIEELNYSSNLVVERYAFLKVSVNNVVYFLFSVVLAAYLIKLRLDAYFLMNVVFFIGVVNSAVILVGFLNPEFRKLVESNLFQPPMSNINYEELDWRLRGVASAGGASLSLFNAVCIVFGIICSESKRLNSIVFFLGACCCLISCFVIARTGLMVGLFFLAWWLIKTLSNPLGFRFYLVLSLCALLVYVSLDYIDEFERILPWALEVFINLTSGKGATSSSTEHLATMFDVPDMLTQILFGFGFFESNAVYRSDSGYIKTIFSIGVVFSLALYLSVFYLLSSLVIKSDLKNKIYMYALIVILVLCEVKEPFLYQNYTSRVLYMVMIFLYLQRVGGRLVSEQTEVFGNSLRTTK